MTAHCYTYPEAAEVLRVQERWLRRDISNLPHSRKGKVVTFSEADLDRIDAMHHHEPTIGPFATVPSAPSSTAHPLAHLKPFAALKKACR
ncbi:helix-turn-helix domain-containing protein [Streptomyces rimosus]|uniref:helix-turn-helix domain-containing protein n=1 Tax=Streptomyces rimosus TaxID=1927 RepID=UPI0004C1B259|nr:helix-turn-helix domain-containing protein [Streptomyces rimosus]